GVLFLVAEVTECRHGAPVRVLHDDAPALTDGGDEVGDDLGNDQSRVSGKGGRADENHRVFAGTPGRLLDLITQAAALGASVADGDQKFVHVVTRPVRLDGDHASIDL